MSNIKGEQSRGYSYFLSGSYTRILKKSLTSECDGYRHSVEIFALILRKGRHGESYSAPRSGATAHVFTTWCTNKDIGIYGHASSNR